MEPIASPTRSDLLQKINEKNIVSIPIIYCVKLQGNMRLFRWDCLSDFECSDGSKRYRRISLECFSAATYHFGSRCTGVRGICGCGRYDSKFCFKFCA